MASQVYDRETTLQLIGRVQDIPSLPDRYARIQEVIDDPTSSASDLAHAIDTDQATSAMVLKVANSPMYNPTHQYSGTLPMAIARLGTQETGHIAMTMSLIYGFAIPVSMPLIRVFWAHAFGVALLSRHMADLLGFDKEELFIAGLLHDIGRVILGIRVDMKYFEGEMGPLYGDDLIAAEQLAYGIDHAEVGAEILRLWQFPKNIRDAVGNHHNIEAHSATSRILRLANIEAHKLFPNTADIAQVNQTLKDNQDLIRILLEQDGLL